MIMNLFKKSVHSFLGLTNTTNMDNNKYGLGLVTATDDGAYRSPMPPLESPPFSLFSKKDPGGIGFIDDMGGGVDGLMSCTESLGFESSDERIDHQMEEMDAIMSYNQSSIKTRWRKDHHHHEVKKFPPPLSSFNRSGQPSFFLRSVRSDGRLELTEVRIDRPEILRVSREDGRLRLHLIREDEDDEVDIDSEYNEYEQDEETIESSEEEEEEKTLEEKEEEEEEEEEERVGEWKLEGFRRCNEMMGHHHHQNMSPRPHHQQHHHNHLHVWSQQCVPTR